MEQAPPPASPGAAPGGEPPRPTGPSPSEGQQAAAANAPPSWPPWFAFVGFIAALTGTLVAVGVIAVVAGIESGDDTPTLTIVATLVQGIFFVGTALVLARSITAPRPWHFGFRRAPLWGTIGWATLGMLSFYLVTAIYAVLVDPSAEQEVTESLGADDGTFGLIAAGVMVIVVAPVVEEMFFRGFFYRALRTRYPVVIAALIDGLVFGIIHFDFEGADGLLILPPLALLGLIFCLVYERTGTLYAVIGLHALNNTVAFSAQADDGWRVAVVAGPLMLIACAVVPRLLPDGPAPLPPAPRAVGPDPRLSSPVQ
jgi:membrane protease YdiL (CAAX protease family)